AGTTATLSISKPARRCSSKQPPRRSRRRVSSPMRSTGSSPSPPLESPRRVSKRGLGRTSDSAKMSAAYRCSASAAPAGLMGSDVEDPGLAVVFDRAIPPFIEENLADAVDEMCVQLDIERASIDRFCCHPGGVKVIDAIESALHLNQGELNLEREVLRDYGNMSAPTVMFVLERLLERGLPNRVMMTAFGPGFTCAGLLLEAA